MNSELWTMNVACNFDEVNSELWTMNYELKKAGRAVMWWKLLCYKMWALSAVVIHRLFTAHCLSATTMARHWQEKSAQFSINLMSIPIEPARPLFFSSAKIVKKIHLAKGFCNYFFCIAVFLLFFPRFSLVFLSFFSRSTLSLLPFFSLFTSRTQKCVPTELQE